VLTEDCLGLFSHYWVRFSKNFFTVPSVQLVTIALVIRIRIPRLSTVAVIRKTAIVIAAANFATVMLARGTEIRILSMLPWPLKGLL